MKYFVEYYNKKDYNLYYPYGLNRIDYYGQIYCYRRSFFFRKIKRKNIYLVKKTYEKYSDDGLTREEVKESVKKECEDIIELLNNGKFLNKNGIIKIDK